MLHIEEIVAELEYSNQENSEFSSNKELISNKLMEFDAYLVGINTSKSEKNCFPDLIILHDVGIYLVEQTETGKLVGIHLFDEVLIYEGEASFKQVEWGEGCVDIHIKYLISEKIKLVHVKYDKHMDITVTKEYKEDPNSLINLLPGKVLPDDWD